MQLPPAGTGGNHEVVEDGGQLPQVKYHDVPPAVLFRGASGSQRSLQAARRIDIRLGGSTDGGDPHVWSPIREFVFRNRDTGEAPPFAYPALGPLPDGFRALRRVTMRGLYLEVPSWLAAAAETLGQYFKAST